MGKEESCEEIGSAEVHIVVWSNQGLAADLWHFIYQQPREWLALSLFGNVCAEIALSSHF